MNRTVLLTGATGFVGRQVLRSLIDLGVTIHVVVREGNTRLLESHHSLTRVVTTPDLFGEDADWWKAVCEDIDTVLHVAWYAEPGEYLHSPRNLDCLLGTLKLAKGAMHARVRRFVGVGTCFEYDVRMGYLSVDTPLRPQSPYAAAKAAAFTALSQILPTRGLEFAWCRLFYLFGEGEDERRLAAHIRSRLAAGERVELTSGEQIRDYLDVHVAARDIAESAIGTIQGALNVCSGVPTTVRQLAERIADEYGRRDLLKFGALPERLDDPPCVVGVKQS